MSGVAWDGWESVRREAAEGAEELADPRRRNDLTFYLVSRFIVVLAIVAAIESALVWLESITFLPLLQRLASDLVGDTETTSVWTLLQLAWTLLRTVASPGTLLSTDVAAQSAAIALVVVMVLLLAVPLLAGAFVFALLVSRKVRALQARRERELAQIEQQRSQFITDVAHDLRTPLMAISGMAHALTDGLVRETAQREEYLRSIRDKADSMGVLVNAVFDYTKLDSATFELKRESIDLAQLLLQEAARAYADAEQAGMRLTTCIPEERCPVFADPVQLGRVVANLVANAIRHNPAGIEVSVILVRQAATTFVMVADTGVPLTGDPDELFRPFSKGDSARTDPKEGSGLGLSICKRIADMHGYPLGVAQPYGRFTKAFVIQCALSE